MLNEYPGSRQYTIGHRQNHQQGFDYIDNKFDTSASSLSGIFESTQLVKSTGSKTVILLE